MLSSIISNHPNPTRSQAAAAGLVMAETLLAMSKDVSLVEHLSSSFHWTLWWAHHSDNISLRTGREHQATHNYHLQRKEFINDLGWNQVLILMKGWTSRTLIRAWHFQGKLDFLPRIPVDTMRCEQNANKNEKGKEETVKTFLKRKKKRDREK